MERTPVNSSMVKSAGYEDGVIEAELLNGQVYRYTGFDQKTFDEWMAADSIGGFFNRHIKKGCQSCTRVQQSA